MPDGIGVEWRVTSSMAMNKFAIGVYRQILKLLSFNLPERQNFVMETHDLGWSINIICRRKAKIDPRPQYQRGPVWSLSKKQLLIDTILRKYDIPKLYLRKLNNSSSYEHEVTDGQQRLRAIWEFQDDKYALGQLLEPLPKYGDLSGKSFSELPSDLQDEFETYRLTVMEISDASEIEIRDLFSRLQEGVPLNPAEKRNAMLGKMRDFIADLANHRVFLFTNLPGHRNGWDDLAAHIVRLELAGGPVNLKAEDLKKMYEAEQKFDIDGTTAKKVKRLLNYLERVLKDKPPEMDIKWGFVDLYLAISYFDSHYVIRDREIEFFNFYTAFEQERRGNLAEASSLLEPGRSEWERDLYKYIEAFVRDGGKRDSIQKRHNVYVQAIHTAIPNLIPKDSNRNFTPDQRLAIWRRDNETCVSCNNQVAFDNMHADHKIPHSLGGVTTVDNGQTLCAPCNLKKGAKPSLPNP